MSYSEDIVTHNALAEVALEALRSAWMDSPKHVRAELETVANAILLMENRAGDIAQEAYVLDYDLHNPA